MDRTIAALRWLMAAVLALGTSAGTSAAQAPIGGWQIVLAAGDDAEPVFDNATRALAEMFAGAGVAAGDIHRLSASPDEIAAGVEPADKATLLRRIGELPVPANAGCLVFLTSHGTKGEGLWLARSQKALYPDELADALSRDCSAVPTVAIVSGCYSGAFAAGAMARPNRIVLTAARADRPSFGCAVERRYTFFDECLIGALPLAQNWRAAAKATDRCVRKTERDMDERPSEPQAFFGHAVAGLATGLDR
jgi:hypothetical protein